MSSTSINDTTVAEDTAADFSYVGRKQGKTHYYDAFNQHLKDEGLFMAKDDRDFMRGKGRWKTLAAEQYDAAQIVRRQELAIRVSPLKLNLVAKLVRGLTVRQAVAQLTFSKKKHAKTTLQLLSDACREAREKFGFIPDQLELDQIYVGKGEQQKRQRIMGKGRTGLGYRRWAHLTVHLREIDFDGKISSSRDVRAARHWMKLKLQTQALVERENDREQRSAGGAAR